MRAADTLEHVLADFAASSSACLQYAVDFFKEHNTSTTIKDVLAKAKEAPFIMMGPGSERIAIHHSGLVWFANGKGGQITPVGKPEDYLAIRDDAAALKDFMGTLLDKGPIYYGTSYWNQDGDWKPSEYAIWMYKNSAYEPFQRSMEKVVVEMLNEEAARQRISPGIIQEKYLAAAKEATKKRLFEAYKTDDPRYIIQAQLKEWRKNRKTKQGDLKEFFDNGKNFWPLAHGSREKFLPRKERDTIVEELSAADWQYRKLNTKTIDRLAELSIQPMRSMCRQESQEQYQQQYQKLIGLLEIITALGTPQNGFAAAFELLSEKAEQKWLYKHPNIVSNYPWQDDNIYDHTLLALTAIQPDDRLASFWLDQIRTDPSVMGVYLSEYALLKSTIDKEAMLPRIVRALQERRPLQNPQRDKANLFYGMDRRMKEEDVFTGFGWLRNGLFSSEKRLLLRQKGIFLDRETFTLHLSSEIQQEGEKLRITFDRYTSEGKSTPITVLYDKKITEQYSESTRAALVDCAVTYEYATKRGAKI